MDAVRRRRGSARSDRGSELLEMALILPILLLLLAGMFDFGFMFRAWQIVTNAAREGARVAILPNYTLADVQARVQSYLDVSGLAGTPTTAMEEVTLETTPGGPTVTARRVSVDYTYNYLYLDVIGGLFGGSYTTVPLHGVATMRIESAAAPPAP